MSELFIGKKVKIVESKNKTLEGISGIIVDETKSTFVIRADLNASTTEKRVLKNSCIFIIDGKNVDGKKIIQKSSERLKNGKYN
jgi:RNase P/RNase MRP subunit p29